MRPVIRLLALLLLAALALLPSDLLAQPQAPAPQELRDEPATKFDKFVLSKGVVRVREFYEIGTMPGSHGGRAKFEVARAYTPGRTDYVLALRIEATEAGRLNRQRTGAMDAEEVASLAAALPQMAKMIDALRQGQQARSTEVDYRGGSLRVGFFMAGQAPLSNLPAGASAEAMRQGAFVQVGEVGPLHVFFELKELDRITSYVNQALAKIKELQQGK